GLNMIEEAGLGVDDFAYGKNGAAGFFRVCRELNERDLTKFKLRKRFVDEAWITSKAKEELKSRVESLLASGLARIHGEIIELYETNFKLALTAHYMMENIFLAAIVSEIKQLIEEYKARNNVVPISEFNVKVYEIVKYSPVPFIYAILGEKYQHYLIDEFQDTSRMQWENLFPLIDNALAYEYFNLAVGDGKQSIYRWRGGDVEIMVNEIEQGLMGEHLDLQYLEENYRSRDNIVQFNNDFFENICNFYKQENPLLGGIYRDIMQFHTGLKGGFVSLRFIPESSRKDEADPMVFDMVNGTVTDCLENLGYKLNDIAVLVRTKNEGRKIAENLLEQGHPVVSPDSLILSRVPLVRFLVDVLAYLNNPADKMVRSSIIFYLSMNQAEKGMNPEEVGNLFIEGEMEESLLLPEIRKFFSLRDFLIRMPVYEVMEEVIRIFRLQDSLDFKTGGYLQAFLDIVSNYSTENNVDFSSFLDWWESNEEDFALEVPENVDAIKIMTIHKAKGLEFPVVIVPYADWKHSVDRQLWLRPDGETFKLDPPLEIPMPVKTRKRLDETLFAGELAEEKKKVVVDNINMLYVAFTRAVDHLYIISQKQKERVTGGDDSNNDYSNYELLRDFAVPWMGEGVDLEESYWLGERLEKPEVQKKTREIHYEPAKGLISTQWYKKITIRRKATEFWRFDGGYLREEQKWGILVHDTLSRVRTMADVPVVVSNIMNSGEIEVDEREMLIRKIDEIFEIEQVRSWFDPGNEVFTESPIITDEGVIRPDRVTVSGDVVTIVDFKTGKKQKTHDKQLLTYMNALMAMGYDKVEAFLLYLEDGVIRQVKKNNLPAGHH
ncbi:MAG: UvrD-helicase domain-containing protein, partial [bacterium]|nr:UvrD-helicase domain-containing protein [bacterium]